MTIADRKMTTINLNVIIQGVMIYQPYDLRKLPVMQKYSMH
jgi:hypothetical protein